MTKRFSTLEKKLQKLQSQILQFAAAVTTAGNPIPETLSKDIEQRFIFLNSLLSAEIASSPSKPHHLHHVAHRLADLESTFHTFCNSHSADSTLSAADLETKSNCSCTESCLKEEDEEVEKFYAATDKLASPQKEGSFCGIKDCFMMGLGFITGSVGMCFVMIQFCACFHQFTTHQGLAAPT